MLFNVEYRVRMFFVEYGVRCVRGTNMLRYGERIGLVRCVRGMNVLWYELVWYNV